ncbi:hypothetical protein [Spirosoma areae]
MNQKNGVKNLLYLLSLLLFVSCSEKKTATQEKAANQPEVASSVNPEPPIGSSSKKTISKNSPVANAGKWLYEKTTDKEGRTVQKASITSPNLLQFGFPYAGGSTATLTIRKRDSGTNVYLHVSKGQFNRSFQGGNARIGFDGKPASTYAFSAAENGSANIIFFDEAQALIDRMNASRNMIIDVEFYAQGRRQIEFRTADLTWN